MQNVCRTHNLQEFGRHALSTKELGTSGNAQLHHAWKAGCARLPLGWRVNVVLGEQRNHVPMSGESFTMAEQKAYNASIGNADVAKILNAMKRRWHVKRNFSR
jgi:hypothetical protein